MTQIKKEVYKIPIISKKSKKKLIMMDFSNAKLTKSQIKAEVDKVSKQFKKQNVEGSLLAKVYYGKESPVPGGWLNAKWIDFGETVRMPKIIDYIETDYEEPEYFSKFQIILKKDL